METRDSTHAPAYLREGAIHSDLPKGMSRATELVIWSVILLAFLARIPLLHFQTVLEWADGVSYAVIGKNIVTGNGIRDWYGVHTLWPPFYPTLLGLASLAVPDLEMAGRVVSLVAGLGALLWLYLISRTLFSKEAALYAAALMALHPQIARSSLAVMSESTYVFLTLAAVCLALKSLERVRISRLTCLGLLLGCAYLTRPEAIGFVPVLSFIILCAHFSSQARRKKAIWGVVALLSVFLVLALPYVLFLRVHTGEWQISGKTHFNVAFTDPRLGHSPEEKYGGLSADGTKVGLERVSVGEVGSYWLEHPFVFGKRYVTLFLDQYFGPLPKVFHPLLLILAGIGLYTGRWREQTWGKLLILAVLFPFFVYPISHVEERFMIPLLPFMLIWTGQGAAAVVGSIQKSENDLMLFRRRIPMAALAHVGAFFVLLLFFLSFLLRPFDIMGKEEKVLGKWVKEQYGPGAKIMERRHLVAFYADGVNVGLPYAPLADLLKYAARVGAEYLVVSEGHGNPELQALVNGTKIPPQLTRVYTLNRSAENQILNKTVLYRLSQP